MASEDQIQVDRDSCIGSGNCVEAAPRSFALDDDGVAVHLGARDSRGAIDAAIASCPAAAIIASSEGDTQSIRV